MLKIFFSVILSSWILSAHAAPQVIVTIKPIHSLVASVMKNVETPHLLLTGGESPHTYNLRPSQAKQLYDSTLIIWVGAGVETFLIKPLENVAKTTQVLSLADVLKPKLLHVREGGSWEKHEKHHHDEEAKHDDHEHSAEHEAESQHLTFDQHIWLNPQNAKLIVAAIATKLSELDAANAPRYQENALALQTRLDELDKDLQEKLRPNQAIPYLVFHDAYQYFEQHYHLTAVGSITLSPENPPSAKRIQQLRRLIKKLQVRCVFSEPQFESQIVNTLLEGSTVKHGTLDPVGATLIAGTEAYFELLQNLAKNFNLCLNSQ